MEFPMAQETNPSLTPVLCATGCGFYGNPRNNGMCSVCYKEHLNRQQKQSSDCGLSQLSPMGAVGSSTADASAIQRLEASLAEVDTSSGSAADMARTIQGSLPVTQQMTEMSISREDNPDSLEPVVSQPTASSPVTASSDEVKEDTPKPKKNKCFMCRKRVGLTGFDCRCGNLFCGVHRYSDKHNCPYDYKAEAAAKIRKENPVVVADKIQRI